MQLVKLAIAQRFVEGAAKRRQRSESIISQRRPSIVPQDPHTAPKSPKLKDTLGKALLRVLSQKAGQEIRPADMGHNLPLLINLQSSVEKYKTE